MSADNFVNYLNYIKKKNNFDFLDAIHFNESVNNHYYSYFLQKNNANNHYYSYFPQTNNCCNNNVSNLYDYLPLRMNHEITNQNYSFSDGWYVDNTNGPIKKTDMNIKKNELIVKKNELIEKKKKNIEVKVNNIDDILKIIDDNQYCEDTEYNIDLKSLHNIKSDLIELNNMVGMKTLKETLLNQILYFMQKLHANEKCNDFKHTVIYGPPGTGKTEIAKLLGKIYSKIGILNSNNDFIFKKVTRNDLIAGYLGQTAIKTRGVINQCIGGVLFIDEAYSLGSHNDNDSFSNECIDILCEALSDHKDNLMVIIAGYEDEINNRFFSINKGLKSRFIWKFNIENYSCVELMEIFKKKIEEINWSLYSENVLNKNWFENKYNNFKNFGRDMEILLFYVKISHSRRIYGKDLSLRKKICEEDLENGYKMFLENNKKEENNKFHGLYV